MPDMEEASHPLARRLVQVCGLEGAEASRVVDEVLDAFDGTVDDFIAARHDALQREGWSNEAIYRRIREELAGQRFRAPALSERQIRRRIYG